MEDGAHTDAGSPQTLVSHALTSMATENLDGERQTGRSEPGESRAVEALATAVPIFPDGAEPRQSGLSAPCAAPNAQGQFAEREATGRGDKLSPPREALTEYQEAEAAKRRLLLIAAKKAFLLKGEDNQPLGLSCVKVSRLCGVPNNTLWSLLQLAERPADWPVDAPFTNADRCEQLISGPTALLAPGKPPGQCSGFAVLLQVPAITQEMIRLYAATMGASCDQATKDRRTGSIATALKRLGDFALVPSPAAARLRGGSKPKCLVDFLKRAWTPEVEAKFRGQKHYTTSTICGRRELKEELADGSCVPLQPGRVWVFDDMSSNIPFWYQIDEITDAALADKDISPLIKRHGCGLGRQGLYAWDWASGAWLGLELVGRLRDAYQASDILRFIRRLMLNYGKPERIVMEKSVWAARCIAGWAVREIEDMGIVVEIEDGWRVPEMEVDESARINDGIKALGVDLVQTHSPRGKPIEGAFNYHQRLVPTFLNPGEGINIGRHAGEFEWSAKKMRQAGAGVGHPRDLGFVHIDRLADVAWQAMVWEGQHVKESRNGKPMEILATWLKTSPLPALTERDLAVFLPEKRRQKLTGGVLSPEVNGVMHQFLNPEVFAAIGDGVYLDYAFDPAEPSLGAAVYSESGFLCWANYLPAGPVISARDRSQDPAVQMLKRYKLAHRTAARMLDFRALRGGEFKTLRTAERRDGAGCVATVATGDQRLDANCANSREVNPGTRGQAVPTPTDRVAAPVRELERAVGERERLERFAKEALADFSD